MIASSGSTPPQRNATAEADAALHGFASSWGRRPRAARWLSRWLLTETYSPSAIETAPPISAARPADEDGAAAAGRTRDADHDRGDRDDAVVGAEHAGAQPVGAAGGGALVVPPEAGSIAAASSVSCVMPPSCASRHPAASKARRSFPVRRSGPHQPCDGGGRLGELRAASPRRRSRRARSGRDGRRGASRATDRSALVIALTWVRMSMQYCSSSTIRCRPRAWPSMRLSRARTRSFSPM